MGCGDSRETGGDKFQTAAAVSGGFISGKSSSSSLIAPIDKLDHLFKSQLNEKDYGPWEKRTFDLDENLQLKGDEEFNTTL
jgi:hypothetical protein